MNTSFYPPPRIVRMRELTDRIGRCKTIIYADIKRGRFPKPIRIGRQSVGWLETDLQKWLDDRIAESRDDMGK